MPMAEVASWTAWEQVYGPLLIHDRIDFAVTQLSMMLYQGKRRRQVRDFLPPWLRDRLSDRSADPARLEAFFKGLAGGEPSPPSAP